VVVMATTVVVGVCLWAFDTVFAFLTRLVYRI
jgi:preprotein translocase subunit SecE